MYIHQISFGTPEFDEALRLRYEVLRKPLGMEYNPIDISKEYDQIHLAAFNQSNKMIAYLNLTALDEQTVKMRQVAVMPELQGKGVGTLLVKASEERAREEGFKKIVLNARDVAIPFYLKLDYLIVGEPFTEVNIPHHKMEKVL